MAQRRAESGLIILLIILIAIVVCVAVYLYFTGQSANCQLNISNGTLGAGCGVHHSP